MHGAAPIKSKNVNGSEVVRGFSQGLRDLSGATAARVIEASQSRVAEHAHDWPVLSLYVIGSCLRRFDGVETAISGPCAVLHPLGAFHSTVVGVSGLEQIDIEFDPLWLWSAAAELFGRVHHWRGGSVGHAATDLAKLWAGGAVAEETLRAATKKFIELAWTTEPRTEPTWLSAARQEIEALSPPTTLELAKQLDLHPAWLTQAYRLSTGEGLQQTLMRKRVERATRLLRETGETAAEIAAASGFCDQSHMIRCFRHILARTPAQVRAEAVHLRAA